MYTLRLCLKDKRLPNISNLYESSPDEDRDFRTIQVFSVDPNREVYKKWGYYVTVRPEEDSLEIVRQVSPKASSITQLSGAVSNLVKFYYEKNQSIVRSATKSDTKVTPSSQGFVDLSSLGHTNESGMEIVESVEVKNKTPVKSAPSMTVIGTDHGVMMTTTILMVMMIVMLKLVNTPVIALLLT